MYTTSILFLLLLVFFIFENENKYFVSKNFTFLKVLKKLKFRSKGCGTYILKINQKFVAV